ncbi:MAG TPA: Ig-like domain-containing protein, partial [Usitatibacter sp.]|nr:Ig-like domain-containing protein [Usitatibacter sp.]
GLEIEGGNNNVRVWGNYVNNTGTGISSTLTSVGPVYIFRNVWNRNQFLEGAACDSDQRQPMFKSGSSSSFANGRRYLFHNTMLQARATGCQYGLGGGAGIGGTGSTQLVNNTVSMNNIYDLWKPQNGSFYQIGSGNTFSNDMTDASSPPEANGIVAIPQYAAGNGWQSESGGMYQLAVGTPGQDQGARIANFNDDFLGTAPDVGAAENGAAPMAFGLAAATSTSSAGSGGTSTTTGGSSGPSTGTAPVSAAMDSSAYGITAGSSVTFTATLMGNSGTPTGNVTFQADGNAISGCVGMPVSSGKALCGTSALAAGSHAITGAYSGDAVYASGIAGPITETVAAASSTLPLGFGMDSSAYTIHRGDAVTFMAYIPGTGGTVKFQDGGNAIAGCSAVAVSSSGTAQCTTKRLSVGQHSIRGVYSGSATTASGVAGPITETVLR